MLKKEGNGVHKIHARCKKCVTVPITDLMNLKRQEIVYRTENKLLKAV